ncbi:hypothetical protein [Rhodovulum sp. YEN HP10]|uniref:hypothetical protein n=1 Tax=Rhodovulum sp. HP10 TaxID=3387397 RepID=UPI0039DFA2AA
MTARRDKLVKVRYSEEEYSRLQKLCRAAGPESHAGYVRRRSLEHELGTGAIADLIGQVGVTLNAEDISPAQLDHLSLLLGELTLEIRKVQRA